MNDELFYEARGFDGFDGFEENLDISTSMRRGRDDCESLEGSAPCEEMPRFCMPHNHQYLGIVRACDEFDELHFHPFMGVTGPAIRMGQGHYHRFRNFTENTDGHYHKISGKTGPSLNVGNGRHIHIASGDSAFIFRHRHTFFFATLINAISRDAY